MKQYFYDLADKVSGQVKDNESYTAWFSGEESKFCRINQNKVRQAGDVFSSYLDLRLIRDRRNSVLSVGLSGDLAVDSQRIGDTVATLRKQLDDVEDDPYLMISTDIHSTEQVGSNKLGDAEENIGHILATSEGQDLVGIYAHGATYRGFANSFGQRNWQSSHTMNFDYSYYLQGDKAVKGGFGGFEFDRRDFESRFEDTRKQLAALGKPTKDVKPGKYRVYLAPSALAEVTDMLCWGGFGKKDHMTKRTPLLKMTEEGKTLHSSFYLSEDTAGGVAPGFNADGYLKPDSVELIAGGKYKDCLVSARSAKEFDVAPNGASGNESPGSLALAGGQIADQDILSELGTGLYINNLWYLNYSDRMSCRLTGMTRFAAFWVENGTIVAPINVMRFDESVYRMFGENLHGLTERRDFMMSPQTYGGRDVSSNHLPGAIINEFNLTL